MKNRKLKTFKEFSEEHVLSHELPYWDFIDDLAVLADGSLCAGFRLNGLAIETWDVQRINRLTEHLRSGLNSLNDSIEVSFCVQMDSDFSDLIGAHEELKDGSANIQWIADARIAALREHVKKESLLKPTLYVFLYERLKSDGIKKKASFLASLFKAPKLFESLRREQFEQMKQSLERSAQALSDSLGRCGLRTSRLSNEDLRNLVYRFLNPTRAKSQPLPLETTAYREQEFTPEEIALVPELQLPTAREQLVFSDLIQGYDTFYYDGYFHRIVSLRTMPENTHAGMMAKLCALPFHYWLDVHVQVPEQSQELSELQAKRRMAHSMSLSHGGRATDLETEAQLQSTEELLRELIQTGQKIFYFQTAILLRSHDKDELELMTKTTLNKFRELSGAEGLQENVASVKVFKTLLPAGHVKSVRAKRIKTDNLADFLPIYQPHAGSTHNPVCLFHNRQNGLIACDPFDSKLLPNFNSLVTGSSGSGKSFLNNLITAQSATQNEMTFIIDIGGSYRKLCEFMGGQYIEISPPKDDESRHAINPFELEDGETSPSPQKIKFLLALLESMFTDSDGEKLSKLSKSILEEAIIQTYEQIRKLNDRVPFVSDLRLNLEKSDDPDVRNFAKMLYTWTGDRPYGKVLDRENELDLNSDFVVFDLKSLSSYPDLQVVMVLIITDFIIGKVESKKPEYRVRRKRIIMDECWELLKRRATANIMEYWVRTLRKSKAGITFITQGIAEIANHEISSAILGNTATKLILLQKSDLQLTKDILKLNDQEVALISSLTQKKGVFSEAFLISNEDRSVIRVMPTPLEYWLATSDADDNGAFDNLRLKRPELPINALIYEMALKYPRGVAAT